MSFHPTQRHAVAGLLVAVLALGACAGADDPDGPSAAPSALSAADREVNQQMFDCLTGRGFDVKLADSGEIRLAGMDDETAADYQDAQDECRERLVADGVLADAGSRDLRAEYVLVSALHSCLVAAEFPLVELPSEQQYLDAAGAFNILEATAPIDLGQATAACSEQFAALEGS